MTFDEFMHKMQEAFPGATVDEDNYGQLIIYTDLMTDADDNVIPFVEQDDESFLEDNDESA